MKHIRAASATDHRDTDRPTDWRDNAICAGEDPNVFFEPEHVHKALTICSHCPVKTACLDDSLTESAWQWGVRGGMTEEQRVTERRRRQRGYQIQVDRTRAPEEAKFGITRRLQALAAAGVGAEAIRQATGLDRASIAKARRGYEGRMYQRTVTEVKAAYPVLLAAPKGDQAVRAKALAAREGWLGPEAWEGVDIDDPAAQPRVRTKTTAA
ncbi:WhiB family transcriptional regulator [Nocardiopsis dassonvillei]|uniref:WhiB family transcriptional regulator n=1 Tax=Nocardiopsis dassonvillei TaxID=2014 RepID=UPI0020A51AC8|nr:WhiB family transcriptional regulator [Nocardiopsis dassonvillei]MCP3017265.1 WhiB family transcriptional regulator [Nocardiopsis dassonvillei]